MCGDFYYRTACCVCGLSLNISKLIPDLFCIQVDKFIKEGCPVDWRDSNGYTPLMVAGQNGLKRIVKVLLRYSCDMNAQNHRGHTAAHLAQMYEHPDIMEYLVSKGARDDILNEGGKTCHNATK